MHVLALASLLWFTGGLAMTAAAATPAAAAFAAALDAQWNYDKPAESEQRFRAELAKWPEGDPQALEVRTQVARSQALQRRFEDAHATLDGVEAKLDGMPSHLRVRYLLERGRTFNSSGSPERAVPPFREALSLAECDSNEFYAVDAAHMLGIAAPADERLDWNLKALALAEKAADPRAQRWVGSLHNNIGWTYHDRGDYAIALGYWEKALAARKATGDVARTSIAQWTVARGLRSVGRLDDAEAMQRALAAENEKRGEPDGHVFEELAEIALARGDAVAAKPWAAKAHAALKDDPWLEANEAPRLARLAAIAAGNAPPSPAKR